MGVEGSLVPTDLVGGVRAGRRKSWFGDQVGDASMKSSEGVAQHQGATNTHSRVRRGSLVTTPASSDVSNQHGGEGVPKRLKEQVDVKENKTTVN